MTALFVFFWDFTLNFLYKYFGMQSMRVYPHLKYLSFENNPVLNHGHSFCNMDSMDTQLAFVLNYNAGLHTYKHSFENNPVLNHGHPFSNMDTLLLDCYAFTTIFPF